MRVPLIQDTQVNEGQATEVDFFGRSVLVVRTAGQVTYVYGEPDQPPEVGA